MSKRELMPVERERNLAAFIYIALLFAVFAIIPDWRTAIGCWFVIMAAEANRVFLECQAAIRAGRARR